jgi:hypothetical protein
MTTEIGPGDLKIMLSVWTDTKKSGVCADSMCRKGIKINDRYFLDFLLNRHFCYNCGVCLRYSRKRRFQRGAPLEQAEV